MNTFCLTRNGRTNVRRHSGYIIGLLKTLGVPRHMLYVRGLGQNGSFWMRRINHLEILEQARWLYRKQIAFAHPDKAGGSHERTIQLNDTWSKIERRFKAHGHGFG